MDSHGLMVQGFCREKIYSEHDKHIVRAEEVMTCMLVLFILLSTVNPSHMCLCLVSWQDLPADCLTVRRAVEASQEKHCPLEILPKGKIFDITKNVS